MKIGKKLNWISSAKIFNNYCENNSNDIQINSTTTRDDIKTYLGQIRNDKTKIVVRGHNWDIKQSLSRYYEYMQFKRCVFKSNPNAIQYGDSGRITNMEFDVVRIE